MALTNQQVRSANVARILWDGEEIGLMQNVRGSDDYAPEPCSGIGDIHVREHVPTIARHVITASSMALRLKSLYQLGLIPENGDVAMNGLIFDIEIFDKSTNTILRKYLGCTYSSGDITVQKHAVIGYDMTFFGMDVAGTP